MTTPTPAVEDLDRLESAATEAEGCVNFGWMTHPKISDFERAFNPATALSLISALRASEAERERAEGDRDALRQAIGFKPGALKEDRDADIVIIDAKALRPAMVEARRARDDAQVRLATIHAYAGEEIRSWVKERFGRWITHKTAWTLADRLFGSERAALRTRPSGGDADGGVG
jgi:hypothetical protein